MEVAFEFAAAQSPFVQGNRSVAALVLEGVEFPIHVTDQNRETGVLHRLHLTRSKLSDIHAQNLIRHSVPPLLGHKHQYRLRASRENNELELSGCPWGEDSSNAKHFYVVLCRESAWSRARLEFFVLPKPPRTFAPGEVHNHIEIAWRIR
jgi:hypothetical protein